MKTFINVFYLTIISAYCVQCVSPQITNVASPSKDVDIQFFLKDGQPHYTVSFKNQFVVDSSSLGFELKDLSTAYQNFIIINTRSESVQETWTQVWGEDKVVENNYNELTVELKDDEDRLLNLSFRAYDDGIGFRYEFPEQEGLKDFIIMEELTEFNLTGDHHSWWIPADYDSYEYTFSSSRLSDIDATDLYVERPDRKIENLKAANTPLTMKTNDGLYLSIHEANLTNYAGMTLGVYDDDLLKSELVPWGDGTKVKASTPFKSPWRMIQISESPAGLAESKLILNLNEPNKLEDVSWIQPMKYIGIWWEMHLGKSSWARRSVEGSWSNDASIHGATTENAKQMIDFSAANNIPGVLVEGWNTGWEYWGLDTAEFFDFVTPYEDFDIEEVIRYANEKGVYLVGHHETSGDAQNYQKRLEDAYAYYEKMGVHAVKTGYAGDINPRSEYHHGQYMVRHYREVLETAAKHKVMVDAHEPIKGTGLRRTYPNMMTREGVRGMEYNAWSEGNDPTHTVLLPFTRGLAGPIDYTPGIFDLTFDDYKDAERVHTTLAKQLALYVVIYSPLQMAADLIENYEGHPAFQFIRDVPTDWDRSKILAAEIGEYVITARKNGEEWYVGGITNEQGRTIGVKLDFLEAGKTYKVTSYQDDESTDWQSNPQAYKIEEFVVTSDEELKIAMAPGGGYALRIQPASENDQTTLQSYN